MKIPRNLNGVELAKNQLNVHRSSFKNQEPRTKNQEPRTKNQNPEFKISPNPLIP